MSWFLLAGHYQFHLRGLFEALQSGLAKKEDPVDTTAQNPEDCNREFIAQSAKFRGGLKNCQSKVKLLASFPAVRNVRIFLTGRCPARA